MDHFTLTSTLPLISPLALPAESTAAMVQVATGSAGLSWVHSNHPNPCTHFLGKEWWHFQLCYTLFPLAVHCNSVILLTVQSKCYAALSKISRGTRGDFSVKDSWTMFSTHISATRKHWGKDKNRHSFSIFSEVLEFSRVGSSSSSILTVIEGSAFPGVPIHSSVYVFYFHQNPCQ